MARTGVWTDTAAWLWSPRGVVFLLASYVALHISLRLILSGTVGVDEVAETIFAQSLNWAYYPRQPPLYTWLVWAFFELFGVAIHSLALLKYALVAATYWFLYLGARRILDDARLAFLAAASPLLIYSVGWQVHIGFTNTVLLMAALAATFLALLRVIEDRTTGAYLALGVAMGVGILSKFGYPLFAISLLGAALMQPTARRAVLDRRMILTLAVAGVLVAPYFALGFEGAGALETVFAKTMKQGGGVPYLAGVASGFVTLIKASIAFLLPLLAVLIVIFPRAALPLRRRPPAAAGLDPRRLLEHFFLIAFALLALAVLVGGVTFFKSRWMHPFLLLFPLYFFCRVRDAGFTKRQLRGYGWTLVVSVILVVGFRVAQATIGPPLCHACRLSMPYPKLARQIEARGFERGTILAANEHIAGNFRMRFPDSRVISMTYLFYEPPLETGLAAHAGQCLAIWDARAGETMPPEMRDVLTAKLDAPPGAEARTGIVTAEPHFRDGRVLRLRYVLMPGRGRCR